MIPFPFRESVIRVKIYVTGKSFLLLVVTGKTTVETMKQFHESLIFRHYTGQSGH